MKKSIKNQLKTMKFQEKNALTKHVIIYLLNQGSNENIESHIQEILKSGCVSGVVSHLIYNFDCYKFFDKFYEEIEEIRIEIEESTGESLKIKYNLKVFFSWLAFEETVYLISNQLEMI